VTELGQRLRRLELELLSTFEGGTLPLEHARRAVAEIEELCTLRAAGALPIDTSSSLAIGMVCAALLFVLRCVLEQQAPAPGSSSSAPDQRCAAVSHGALSPRGTRCTLRAGHFGGHVYGGAFPRQCDARRRSGEGIAGDDAEFLGPVREQRCRLLEHHDGEHLYDDD